MTTATTSTAEPGRVAGTDPYPWPWDGALRAGRLCLVLTGTQRVHAAASLDVPEVTERIGELTRRLRARGVLICHVRHRGMSGRSRPLLPLVGDAGWDPMLVPGADDLVIDATGHDALHDSPLDLELRSRRRDLLVVAGFASEVTVSSTVRSANDRGYECLTLVDALAPLDRSTSAHELSSVTMSGGIFGALGSSGSLLAALAHADDDANGASPDPINMSH